MLRRATTPKDAHSGFQALESPPPPSSSGSAEPQERKHQRRHQIGKIQDLTWKERAQTFIDGKGGIALESFNVLLSLALVVMSVIDSYESMEFTSGNAAYSHFEIFSTLLFSLDFCLHLYTSDDRLRFVVSPMGIIDILTIVPPIVTYFLASFQLDILQLVRVARVFRMLAVLRLYRIVQSYRGFDYELGVLAFMIFALIFVAAGVFQILEESYYTSINSELQFHHAIYFVFVTMSTVGFGDITPKNTASQFFVIFMIIVVITVIPRQINRLVELSKLQHDYMHAYSVRKRSVQNGGHVVVTGHVSSESVGEFLAEFYRARQGRVNMDVVFLTDVAPADRLQSLLLNAKYRRRVTYLKGSLLIDKDAKRACVEQAAAVFILAAKDNPKHADAADALTILQALAIDKFRFQNRVTGSSSSSARRERDIRCFLQILSPQRTRGLRTITGAEVALNTPRLRTAILARSIVCPGATALLLNLIYSASEHDVDEAKASNVPWVAEYAHGLQHQLFPVFLPRFYDGMLYESAAELLYTTFSIIFVALYDKLGAKDHGKRIRLSPFGQPLREDDIGFFVAPSASFAKHAVEALAVRELGARNDGSSQLPTLVFSSDNVLDRQSMVTARSPSVDLLSDVGDEDDNDRRFHQQQRLEDNAHALSRSASALSIGPGVTLAHTRGRTSSSDSSSSSSSSSSSASSSSAPSTASTLLSHLPLLPPFTRYPHQQSSSLPTDPASLLRRTSSILAAKHVQRLRDHIVICGPFVHGYQIACYLAQLYKTERIGTQNSIGSVPTVLLLVKRLPSDADFENLPAPLPANVFVERGVSQNVEDLLRVRAFEAKAVLMIPGHWKYHVDEFREESLEELSDHLMDYQVIMSTLSLQTVHDLHHEHLRSSRTAASSHALKRRLSSLGDGHNGALNKLTLGCSVVRSHDSIKYFAYKSSQSNHGRGLHRVARARLTRCSSRFVLSAKRARREDVSGVEAELLLPAAFAPSYAAGEVFVDSVLDTLLCQSFFNPYVIDLVHALAGDYYASSAHRTSASDSPFASSMMKYFTQAPETHGPLTTSSGSSSPGTQTLSNASTGATSPGPNKSSASSSRHGSGDLPSSRSGDPDPSDDGAGARGGDPTGTAADDLRPDDDIRYPVLSTATIASELEGESFKTVFTRGLRQGVLVLGIYRRANDPRRGNTLAYVFTCPSSDASHTVERGDSLHIISKHHAPVWIQ